MGQNELFKLIHRGWIQIDNAKTFSESFFLLKISKSNCGAHDCIKKKNTVRGAHNTETLFSLSFPFYTVAQLFLKITTSSLTEEWSSWENGEYTCVHHEANSVVCVSYCAASQQQTLNSSAHLFLIRFLSTAGDGEKPHLYHQIWLDIHYCLYIPH